MRHRPQSALAVIAAAVTLALAVANASANQLSLSNKSFRVTWTSLEQTNTVNANTVRCPVTLEGSFHSATISKVNEALIGYVTRAAVGGEVCTGGAATILGERLPWHIRYRGFSGTLPTITLLWLGLVGARWQITEPGATCRATTETLEPAIGNVTLREGVAETLTAERNTRITLEGGFFGSCGIGRGAFSGQSQTLTQLGSTARIEVTLIGEPPILITLEPSPVAFGRLEPSQLSLRTVTITAISEVTVNRISMERANYFAITDPNNCVGARLGARARCSFKVVFVAPAEAGRELRDRITVETTPGRAATATVEGST